MRGFVALAALAGLLLVPSHAAHGTEHGLDDQLVRNGDRLLLGSFDAPQPGPLLVIPYSEDPLPCGPDPSRRFLVRLGPDAAVSFAANATHVQALFDLPAEGYVAFAADTHDAVRALILMQENAVALHRLAADVVRPDANDTGARLRTGTMGIPYALPGASGHGFGHEVEGGGIAMAYDSATRGLAGGCRSAEPGHAGLWFLRANLSQSLAPGSLVHVVALYDSAVPQFLPRPLESTRVLQANLYLARPGEDPDGVREALDPRPGADEALPLALFGLGTVALGLPAALRRRP